MLPRKLIIFDYSGSLSRESTLFGEPTYLMKQLKESGLLDLGVTSPGIFWEQIVNPSWAEGSTTQVGYKRVIQDRITDILGQNKSPVSNAKSSHAASFFVDAYLSHSRIDNRWQPVLKKLNMHPSIRTIIATDHYAEATGYVLRFLEELHVQAMSAKAAMDAPHSDASVVVANSADLGFHKDEPRFWEILKNGLRMGEVRHILLIDDFGSNEQIDDSYSEPEKVKQRKRAIVKILQGVFPARVEAVPFVVGNKRDEKTFFDLIEATAATIDRYVAASDK